MRVEAHRGRGHRWKRCGSTPPGGCGPAQWWGEVMFLAIPAGHSARTLPSVPRSWSGGQRGPGPLHEEEESIGTQRGGRGRRDAPPYKVNDAPLLYARQGSLLGLGQPYLPGRGAEAPSPAWRAHRTPSQSLLLGWEQESCALEREGPTGRAVSKTSKNHNTRNFSRQQGRGKETSDLPSFKRRGLHRGALKATEKTILLRGSCCITRHLSAKGAAWHQVTPEAASPFCQLPVLSLPTPFLASRGWAGRTRAACRGGLSVPCGL